MDAPLSVNLREGTKESHRLAERSPFIRSFFEARISVAHYQKFLLQLFHVYKALETCQQQHREHHILGKIYYPSLFRGEALRQDLNFYFGDERWEEMQPTTATESYVQRINQLSNEWVDGLVAHLYTRYLGDLSGGQVLKRLVAKMYNLSSNKGLTFYDFPQIDNYSEFKDTYHMSLDSLPFNKKLIKKVVNEANLAFQLNRDVFDSMINLSEAG